MVIEMDRKSEIREMLKKDEKERWGLPPSYFTSDEMADRILKLKDYLDRRFRSDSLAKWKKDIERVKNMFEMGITSVQVGPCKFVKSDKFEGSIEVWYDIGVIIDDE